MFTPIYLNLLGPVQFGIVGFFILLQSLLGLLDMGASPTLARTAAQAAASGNQHLLSIFSNLLNSFEKIFASIGIVIVSIMFLLRDWVLENWISTSPEHYPMFSSSLGLMSCVVGIRFVNSLYRSSLVGLEDQVWLAKMDTLFSTLKYCGSVVVLYFISPNAVYFFCYQIAITFVELAVNKARIFKIQPRLIEFDKRFDFKAVKKALPFSAGAAYSSLLLVASTQLDRLILSGQLSIDEFGYYVLVSVISMSIGQISSPVFRAITPRLTALHAKAARAEFIDVYREATRLIAVVSLSTVLIVAFFPNEVIYAWTGDQQVSEWGGRILFWLSIAAGLAILCDIQYYLQLATGNLKLHIIGYSIYSVLQSLALMMAIAYNGALGAAIAIVSCRALYLVIWSPIVHKKYLPGIHMVWLSFDVLPIVLTQCAVAYVLSQTIPPEINQPRETILAILILNGALVVASGITVNRIIKSVQKI